MKCKNIMIITLLLIIFTITAVSASDDNSTDDSLTISEDMNDLKIESSENDVIGADNENDAVLAENDYAATILTGNESSAHVFDELQTLIDNTEKGRTLTLEHNYVSNGTLISITNSIIINGNGHKLDAKELSEIFEINADDCTIANLTLCNVKNPSEAPVYIKGSSCKIENCIIENITGGYAAIQLDKSTIINNVAFNNISTTADGGAIYILGSNCLITNSSFTNCSGENGGCIYIGEYNCVIANSSFTNCRGSYGGSIYDESRYSKIINCTFSNSSSTSGGAIYTVDSDCLIANSSFTGCSANFGGCIFNDDGVSNITNCIFSNSNCTYDGGCINVAYGVFNIVNCTFSNSSSASNGGAIHIDEANCLIANSTFIGCSASFGGCIYDEEAGNSSIINCTFLNSKCTENGGVIFAQSMYLIANSSFTGCSGSFGGSIYVYDGISNIVNCSFSNSSCANYGGAIYTKGSSCLIANSSFIGCSASEGGSIHVEEGISNITNCIFSNSSCTDVGGAIYTKVGCLIANSSFTGCSAIEGGCIYIDNLGDPNIINCTFSNSSCTYCGGAIYADGSDCLIANSSFTGCSASDGGSIYINYGDSNITDCTFSNSSCTNNGGAIFYGAAGVLESSTFINSYGIEGGSIYVAVESITISSCSFINSNASDNGGAITWNGYDGVLINCNFTGCTIGGVGGAICWLEDDGLVKNCEFNDCSAYFNGGAISWSGSNGAIENSKFMNDHASLGGAVSCIETSISYCTFINCSSEVDGGAILFESESCSITNSIFIQNHADGNGGAVLFEEKLCSITNSIFIQNHADGNGGAVYGVENNVSDSRFTENTALGKGGAIYNCTVVNCTFKANSKPEIYPFNITVSDNIAINSTKKGEVEINVTSGSETLNITTEDLKDCLSVTYKNGNDTVVINITEYEIKNGILYFTLENCSFETATLNIKCGKSEANVTLNRIYNARIDAVNTVNEFQKGYFTFRLVDVDDGSSLVGKTVSLAVPGYPIHLVIPETTDSDGIVSFKNADLYSYVYTMDRKPLEIGKHEVEISASNPVKAAKLVINLTITPFNIDIDILTEVKDGDVNITATATFTSDGTRVVGLILKVYSPQLTNPYNYLNTDSKGRIIFSANGLAGGNYEFTVSNNDTVNYTAVEKTVKVFIPTPLTVNTLKNTDEGYIQITVPADITKTLTFTIGDNAYTINPGGSKIDLTHLSTGNYAYTISYPGDDKYKSYESFGSIYLTKTVPELTINANDTTFGQGGVVTVLVSDDIDVNFTLLNEANLVVDNKVVKPVGGVATYMVPELNVGKYKINAQSTGDSNYYKSDLYSASFNVAPKISISPEVIIGDDGIITMELGDVSGVILVYVDGELDGSKKIMDGKFIYALSTWVLIVGNHTLTFEYSGNSFDKNVFNYWDNEAGTYKPIEYKFCIEPKQTDTKSGSDNDNLLEILLEDEKGNLLSNATGKIEFEIINQFTKEVQHVVVEVVNGIAVLDISQFKDGDYLISWNYLGDDKHSPISKQLSLKITHKPSRISAGDLTRLYTLPGTYSVTVYGSSGEAISGVPVTFLINNRVVKTVTTNSRGVASITVSENPGSYRITAKTGSISITKTLTVTHLLSLKTVKVKKSGKKLVLTASLKKVNGKYLSKKRINFNFNGRKYHANTNKKGVAKVTINSKVLSKLKAGKKITYQATYLKDTVKKTVKVKK